MIPKQPKDTIITHTHIHVRTPHNRNCNITIYLHYNAHNRVIYLMTCVAVYDI